MPISQIGGRLPSFKHTLVTSLTRGYNAGVLEAYECESRANPSVKPRPAREMAQPTPVQKRSRNNSGKALTAREMGKLGGRAGKGTRKKSKLLKASGRANLPKDAAYYRHEKFSVAYAKHRMRELADAHGGRISAGVGALIETASMDLAAARFLYYHAATNADIALFKESSRLGAAARQNELAAWELASREAKIRPANNPLDNIEALYEKLVQQQKPIEQVLSMPAPAHKPAPKTTTNSPSSCGQQPLVVDAPSDAIASECDRNASDESDQRD